MLLPDRGFQSHSYLKHTNVEVLRLASYLAHRDVLNQNLRKKQIAMDEDATRINNKDASFPTQSLKFEQQVSSKRSNTLPERKLNFPSRSFSPPVRDTDIWVPSQRKPLHQPKERQVKAAEELKIRQLILQSKAALRALNEEMVSQVHDKLMVLPPASSRRPASARLPTRVRSQNQPKSSKSLLRSCVVPLNQSGKKQNKNKLSKHTNFVHWAEAEVNESNRTRPRSELSILSNSSTYQTPRNQAKFKRSASLRNNKSPRDLKILSSYLKRLGSGSYGDDQEMNLAKHYSEPVATVINNPPRLHAQQLLHKPQAKVLHDSMQVIFGAQEFLNKWGSYLSCREAPSPPSSISLNSTLKPSFLSDSTSDPIENFMQKYALKQPTITNTAQCLANQKVHSSSAVQQLAYRFDLEPNSDDTRLLHPDYHQDILFTKSVPKDSFKEINPPYYPANQIWNPNHRALRLPTELHRNLLIGSCMAKEVHQNRWHRIGLLKEARGITVNNVVDWLADEIVDACLESCVMDLEKMSDQLIEDLVRNELDYSGSSSVDVRPPLIASYRIENEETYPRQRLSGPTMVNDDVFEVSTISVPTPVDDRVPINSSLHLADTPVQYSTVTEDVLEFSNQTTHRSESDFLKSLSPVQELTSVSNLRVLDLASGATTPIGHISQSICEKITLLESKSDPALSVKPTLLHLSEEISAMSLYSNLGKGVSVTSLSAKESNEVVEKMDVPSNYSEDFEPEKNSESEKTVAKIRAASSSDTVNDVLRLSQLLSDSESVASTL